MSYDWICFYIMATNRESDLKDKLYKNVQYWIGDLLRIYKDPPKHINCDEYEVGYSFEKAKPTKDLMSLMKSVTVVGVVVSVRNERNEPLTKDTSHISEAKICNRPIVYGKHESIKCIFFNWARKTTLIFINCHLLSLCVFFILAINIFMRRY